MPQYGEECLENVKICVKDVKKCVIMGKTGLQSAKKRRNAVAADGGKINKNQTKFMYTTVKNAGVFGKIAHELPGDADPNLCNQYSKADAAVSSNSVPRSVKTCRDLDKNTFMEHR